MKILLVHNYYQYRGGTDDYVDSLYNLLKNKKQEVYLYSEKSSRVKSLGEKINTGLSLIYSQNNKNSDIIDIFKPDVCHINNIFPIINFSIIKKCAQRRIPIVQTVHDFKYYYPGGIIGQKEYKSDLFNKHPLIYSVLNKSYNGSYLSSISLALALVMNKKTIQNIDSFIFPSKTSWQLLARKLHIKKEKCYFLPHFIRRQIYPDINQKENYFIYIGRISEEKGINELVQVFISLPRLKLIVIGEGPLLSKLKSLKIPNIKFLGYVSLDKKYELLSRALFCIIPSEIEEQGPLVLIESFMCGTPVIVPNLFSFKEKVENNRAGFYYVHNDIEDLRKVILRAASQKRNIYKKMSKFVQEEYLKHYEENTYYKNLIKVYEQLI